MIGPAFVLKQSVFDITTAAGSNGDATAEGRSSFSAEFGPRMTFTSAFSSNAVSICAACGLSGVNRLERSLRYKFHATSSLTGDAIDLIKTMLHDRMTEEEYVKPVDSFDAGVETSPVVTVPIMAEGRKALERINKEWDWDLMTLIWIIIPTCSR